MLGPGRCSSRQQRRFLTRLFTRAPSLQASPSVQSSSSPVQVDVDKSIAQTRAEFAKQSKSSLTGRAKTERFERDVRGWRKVRSDQTQNARRVVDAETQAIPGTRDDAQTDKPLQDCQIFLRSVVVVVGGNGKGCAFGRGVVLQPIVRRALITGLLGTEALAPPGGPWSWCRLCDLRLRQAGLILQRGCLLTLIGR